MKNRAILTCFCQIERGKQRPLGTRPGRCYILVFLLSFFPQSFHVFAQSDSPHHTKEFAFISDTQSPMWVEAIVEARNHNEQATRMLFEDILKDSTLSCVFHFGDVNIRGRCQKLYYSMPRKARINQAGLTHHIMARTFNDLLLFGDDADRKYYLSCLSHRIKETGFVCYARVLMDTHIHLLIRTTDQPLWQLMKPLNSDYAHYYNKKYNRRGPLFSDRYKSIATQDQHYLEQLIRYVHLNPIRAGVCKTVRHLDHFPWSGHRMIMEKENGGFQEIRQVLRRFGKTEEEARKKYREFIEAGLKERDEKDFISDVRASNAGRRGKDTSGVWVIGDAAFQKSVLEKDALNRLTLARYKKQGISLSDVLKTTAEKMDVDEQLILFRSKRTPQAKARMIFCFLARELGFPTRETGDFLGIQQAAVSNAARNGALIAKKLKISWMLNQSIM